MDDQWREILQDYIIYGMLFKALAHDASVKTEFPFKLSYNSFFSTASVWAERKHHEYRRKFTRLGGKVHSQQKRDEFNYFVLVSVKGYQHELYYNTEILRAECQQRLNAWIQSLV